MRKCMVCNVVEVDGKCECVAAPAQGEPPQDDTRLALCIWCEATFPYVVGDEASRLASWEAAKAHDLVCQKRPSLVSGDLLRALKGKVEKWREFAANHEAAAKRHGESGHVIEARRRRAEADTCRLHANEIETSLNFHAASLRSGPRSEWREIDSAPKDGTFFLGYCDGNCDVVRYWGRWEVDDWQPTHWMPLPLPPSDPTRTQEGTR